jgi:DNA-binding LacI/PurR family transcriptional regulator
MANIYDVARLAKVSTTTVSKVLSNTPYVSAATRQRVLDAMRELHYSPSLAARGLTNNRTYVIGLIVAHDPDYAFKDPFVLEIIHGIAAAANDHDYDVLLSTSRKNSSQRRSYDRVLRTGYVDGVVTLEGFEGGIDDQELAERRIPRVSIGYREDRQDINSIRSDDWQGAYQAIKYLLALGHRRLGLISGPRSFVGAIDARLEGMRAALAEYGLAVDTCLMSYGDFSIESGYQATASLLESPERPTAIFAMNDRMALGAMRRARELGLHIPTDLSLVGFDDIVLAQESDPPLTTIRQFPTELGCRATQYLFSLINNEVEQFATVVMPVELVIRSSTRNFYDAG